MTTKPSRELATFAAPGSPPPVVRFEVPEFTALCPATGQPDFAQINIWYQPDKLCVELKSLKLYFWSYRERGAFHETVTSEILTDLVAAISPRWMLVEGDFWVRGGIHTVCYAQHGDVPEALKIGRAERMSYSGHSR